MSYYSQFGVGKNGGGAILDYSPPRQGVTGGARSSTLPASVLDEASLSETAPVDGVTRRTASCSSTARAHRRWVAAQRPDRLGRRRRDHVVPGGSEHRHCEHGRQPEGVHEHHGPNEQLRGADEWSQVSIPFRQNGDSANGAINPTTDDEPTRQELQSFYDALTTTDVGVSATRRPPRSRRARPPP